MPTSRRSFIVFRICDNSGSLLRREPSDICARARRRSRYLAADHDALDFVEALFVGR
jgi:hypothetical protein